MSSSTTNIALVKQANSENWSNDTHNANLQKIDDFAGQVWLKKPTTYVSGQDADDYTTSGFYQLGITGHSPYGSNTAYGVLVVYSGSSGHCQQIFISGNNDNLYIRGRNTGDNAFSEWQRLALYNQLRLAEVTLSAGTNITINWQRCRKNNSGITNGLAVLEVTFTADAAISAGATLLTGAPGIGGNMQFFAAFSDAGATIPLSISGGAVSARSSIASGTKVRFIVSYFWTN